MNRAYKRRQMKIAKKVARNATPAPATNSSPEPSMELAIEHHTAGRLAQAESLYQRILQADPNHLDALNNLGLALHGMGRTEDAITGYRRVLAADPNFAAAHSNLGNALEDLGQLDEAMASYRQALAADPNFAEAHYNLGNVLNRLEQTDDAVASYRRALAIEPGLAEIHDNLGNALRDLGRIEEAVASHRKALAAQPNLAAAHNNLGRALKDLGRTEEAVACYGRALVADPDFAAAHSNLGNALEDLGQLDEAVASYRKALAAEPDLTDTHNNLGIALQRLGQFDAALEHFFRAVELEPGGQARILTLLKAVGDIDSDRVIEKFRRLAPQSPEPSLLAYGLACFRPDATAEASYRNATGNLPAPADEAMTFDSQPTKTGASLPQKIVALLQWGRSGTGFMHSLFDGHPQITTVPGFYLSGFFGRDTWRLIRSSKRGDAVRRFCQLHDVLFDAASQRPVPGETLNDIASPGVKEGYTAMGPNRDRSLSLDREIFADNLMALLAGHERVSRGDFFRMAHLAFEKTRGCNGQEMIFYHLHNPDSYELLNYLRHFPRTKLLLAVREPLQSCESWLNHDIDKTSPYTTMVRRLVECLFKFDQVPFRLHDSRGVRLEDIKLDPPQTMKRLCRWLEIDENDTLFSPTFQGLTWSGDPSTIRFGRTKPVSGLALDNTEYDADPIKRKLGHLFSDRDQLILATLFYPVRVLYGYADRDDDTLARNLREIRPMLDEPFDFEQKIIEATDTHNPRESADYL